MEDIAMFRLEHLEELPGMIGRLLGDDELRSHITGRAYEKVMREHTWDVRAQELLQIVTEMEERES
jgi:spore maturation protein CgeB